MPRGALQGHRGPCWGMWGSRGPMWGTPMLGPAEASLGCSLPAWDLCVRAPQPFGSHAPPLGPPQPHTAEATSAPRGAPAPGRWSLGPCEQNRGSLCVSAESRRSVPGQRSERSRPFPAWGVGGTTVPCPPGPTPLRRLGGGREASCAPAPPSSPLAPPPAAGPSPSSQSRSLTLGKAVRATPHPTPLRTGGSSPPLLPWAWHRPVTQRGPVRAPHRRPVHSAGRSAPGKRIHVDGRREALGTVRAAALPSPDHGFALLSRESPSPAPRLRGAAPKQGGSEAGQAASPS